MKNTFAQSQAILLSGLNDRDDFADVARELYEFEVRRGKTPWVLAGGGIGNPGKGNWSFVSAKDRFLPARNSEDIRNAFNQVSQELSSGDVLNIYISSHGSRPNVPGKALSASLALHNSSLTYKQLMTFLRTSIPKSVTIRMISSACYSGALNEISFFLPNVCSAASADDQSMYFSHPAANKQFLSNFGISKEISTRLFGSSFKGSLTEGFVLAEFFDFPENDSQSLSSSQYVEKTLSGAGFEGGTPSSSEDSIDLDFAVSVFKFAQVPSPSTILKYFTKYPKTMDFILEALERSRRPLAEWSIRLPEEAPELDRNETEVLKMVRSIYDSYFLIASAKQKEIEQRENEILENQQKRKNSQERQRKLSEVLTRNRSLSDEDKKVLSLNILIQKQHEKMANGLLEQASMLKGMAELIVAGLQPSPDEVRKGFETLYSDLDEYSRAWLNWGKKGKKVQADLFSLKVLLKPLIHQLKLKRVLRQQDRFLKIATPGQRAKYFQLVACELDPL